MKARSLFLVFLITLIYSCGGNRQNEANVKSDSKEENNISSFDTTQDTSNQIISHVEDTNVDTFYGDEAIKKFTAISEYKDENGIDSTAYKNDYKTDYYSSDNRLHTIIIRREKNTKYDASWNLDDQGEKVDSSFMFTVYKNIDPKNEIKAIEQLKEKSMTEIIYPSSEALKKDLGVDANKSLLSLLDSHFNQGPIQLKFLVKLSNGIQILYIQVRASGVLGKCIYELNSRVDDCKLTMYSCTIEDIRKEIKTIKINCESCDIASY